MKKIVFLIAFTIFCFNIGHAQVIEGTSNTSNYSSGGDYKIGVKAGFGASTFSGSGFSGILTRSSFYVGGIAEIPAFFDGF